MKILAWSGIVTMVRADWGDEAGSTVTLKLPMAHSESVRNPFHEYTRRRKGRAGTRFWMALTTAGGVSEAIYADEAMLAGWNDSQRSGHTVKFWLCNDAMGHPLEGISRSQELALALTELDDDNEPVDPKMRQRVEQEALRGRQRLSNAAALLCTTQPFWQWINSTDDVLGALVANEEQAAEWLRQRLGVKSRAELDQGGTVAEIFHRFVRKPYRDWLDDQAQFHA